VTGALQVENERLATLQAAWKQEKTLVDEILELRGKLREATGKADVPAGGVTGKPDAASGVGKPTGADGGGKRDAAGTAAPAATPAGAPAATAGATPEGAQSGGKPLSEAERKQAIARLQELQQQLSKAQVERPLVLPSVDEQAVASVVADWTGIPVGRMVKDEIATVLKLAESLGKRVIGQNHALEMIGRRVQTARASLENPNKPIGVFMLAGPSGVGKTETALTLAEALYGGEQNLITINMSEFQEAHTVSTLKGAPPGYIGYGEGGVLTEAVRRKPYSVVLLDEVEKAHPDVHEIFFQVFD